MKILIQRVKYAKVKVKGKLISEINNGILVFLGIEKGDENKINKAVEKFLKIKIIEDKNKKFKYSINEKKLPILIISQITLIPEFKDNKPEFLNSPSKEEAEIIYNNFINQLKEKNFDVNQGIFGEFMEVESVNLGPVNFLIKL